MPTRIEYRAIWTNPYNDAQYNGVPQCTEPVTEPSYTALRYVYPFSHAEEALPTLLGWQKRTVIESDWEDYT